MRRQVGRTDDRAVLRVALVEAKGTLEERLRRGDDELRAVEARGQARPDWEAVWHRLLARYEAVCDALWELEQGASVAMGTHAA